MRRHWTSGWGGPSGAGGSPRGRTLRRDERAAAGVVTIMLAILTVILVLTIITVVWMPVWMKDKESDHMRAVTDDMDQLKSNIDTIILQGDPAFVASTTVTLGTEGYPLLETDSPGRFAINYFRDDVPEFSCNLRNQSGQLNVTATGGMKYNSLNRYYINQEIAYENGALVVGQGRGEVMRIGPQFSVENLGASAKVSFVLTTVSGVESSIQGVGPVVVNCQLVTFNSEEFIMNTPEWVTITTVTEYPQAWSRYYNGTLSAAGFTPGTGFQTTVMGSKVTVAVNRTKFINVAFALVEVDIERNAGLAGLEHPLPGAAATWHLNEGSGSTALDATPNANDLTIVNATWTSKGVQGPALEFHNDSWADCPESASLDFSTTGGVTVEAWVRWAVAPSSGSRFANIYCQGENEFELQHSGDSKPGPINGAFEFALQTNVERRLVWSDTTPQAGVWYHVVATWDNVTMQLRLYVNGALEQSTHINGSHINSMVRTPTIGARSKESTKDRFFTGMIDEVLVYNRALTATEVAMRYVGTQPTHG